MKIGLLILGITSLLMYNIYHDNKILNTIQNNMKYIKMAGVAFAGLSLYVFIKKHPSESGSLVKHASGLIHHLPIDSNSKDLISPLLRYAKEKEKNQPVHINMNTHADTHTGMKRSVSETRKKYVASQQNWRCKHCDNMLDATFEIDHVIELQHGGNNEVSNLEALCRNCHGKKTMKHRI